MSEICTGTTRGRVSFALMHCDWDPKRVAWNGQILDRLHAAHVAVVCDEIRSCWDTAIRAWRQSLSDAITSGASHCFVLQDDMMPAGGFLEAVQWAIDESSDAPLPVVVSFRRPPQWMRIGRYEEGCYPPRHPHSAFIDAGTPWVWGGSVMIPIRLVEDMLAHGAANSARGDEDDSRITDWIAERRDQGKLHFRHYAPEVLDHVGASESLLGHELTIHDAINDWRDAPRYYDSRRNGSP